MAGTMDFLAGATFVHVGIGVVRIERVTAAGFEVADLDGDRFDVEADEADDLLRPLVSAERAAELTDLLAASPGVFSDDPPGRRSRRYAELFDEGTIDEQVEALRAILHDPRNEPAERQNLKRYQDLVLGELAVAQSVTPAQLRVRLARAKGDEPRPFDLLPDPSTELSEIDSIPACPGLETVGAFHVERRIGAGAGALERTFETTPGVWFAYGRSDVDPSGADLDLPAVLLVVRADEAAPADRLGRWAAGEGAEPVGDTVGVEGARLMIGDAVAAADHWFMEAALSRGTPCVGGRLAQIHLGGDGEAQVSCANVDGQVVMVRVQA
jgi:RNA polymerase-interacting CarD/CdnL/TRCF family regulator